MGNGKQFYLCKNYNKNYNLCSNAAFAYSAIWLLWRVGWHLLDAGITKERTAVCFALYAPKE